MDLCDPFRGNREGLEHSENTVGHHTTNGRHTETLHRTTPALHEGIPVERSEGDREREREGGRERSKNTWLNCEYLKLGTKA